MTAPLFHLTPGALDGLGPGALLRLDGAEGHHAATVMRLGVGERLQLSDTVGTRAEAEVTAAHTGALQLRIDSVWEEPALRPHLVLVQALAKDRRDVQAVESATELGIDAIIPWQAERSVARWKPGRETKKHAEWVNTATTAAKQTRRTTIPSIEPLHTTGQYLAALRPEVGVVVLHEVEEISLARVLEDLGALGAQPRVEQIHLVVGPEGGISSTELQQLRTAGARTARLGRHVLRSSTAGPAAIAAAQLLLGRWDW